MENKQGYVAFHLSFCLPNENKWSMTMKSKSLKTKTNTPF